MIKINISEDQFVAELRDFIDKRQANDKGLNGKLGLKLIDVDLNNDIIRFAFEAKEWCKNPYGNVHGGIICSILDTAMGTGAVAIADSFVTTTDLNVNFLRPMDSERYTIQAEYNLIGRNLIRTQGKVFDQDTGKLCATAMAGFMIIQGQTAGLRD